MRQRLLNTNVRKHFQEYNKMKTTKFIILLIHQLISSLRNRHLIFLKKVCLKWGTTTPNTQTSRVNWRKYGPLRKGEESWVRTQR